MANRRFNNQQFTMTPACVAIYAKVTFGDTGAPTLDAPNSKGVVSVTQNSTGNYTFVFGTTSTSLDTYAKLLNVTHVFDTSGPSAAPAAPAMYISNDSIASATAASVTLQFNAAGTAANPASGEIVHLEFDFKNSTAP